MLRFTHVIQAVMAGLMVMVTSAADAASTFFYDSSASYRSVADSPFIGGSSGGGSSSGFFLQNFESGSTSMAGLLINRGTVRGERRSVDSVDGDDGNINGLGRAGHALNSGRHKSITLRFTGNENGVPKMAGLVWTDGRDNARVVVKAWDKDGNYIGRIKLRPGDDRRTGQTAEDRFIGFANDNGISKIKITSNYRGFEIDHVQFSYALSVVPVPAPVALGVAGLAGVALFRRRFMKKHAA